MIAEATSAAAARGMEVVPDPACAALVAIFCRRCGWPGAAHADADVARYIEDPYACGACTWRAGREPGDAHEPWPRHGAGAAP